MLHQPLDLTRSQEPWTTGLLIQNVLRKRARLIMMLPLVVLLLALVTMRFVPLKYRASSVIWIRPQISLNVSETTPDANRQTERQQSSLFELRSLPLAAKVIEKLNLQNEPEFAARVAEGRSLSSRFGALVGPTVSGWLKAIFLPEADVTLKPEEAAAIRQRSLAEYLIDNLAAAPEGTERISLSYRAAQPRLAYEVMTALLEEHQRAKLEQKRERSQITLAALRQRIDFLRSRLDEQSRVLVQGETARLIELQNTAENMHPDEVVSVPPVVPTQPTRPPLPLVMLLSLFAGLAIAVAVTALLEARDYVNRLLERS